MSMGKMHTDAMVLWLECPPSSR